MAVLGVGVLAAGAFAPRATGQVASQSVAPIGVSAGPGITPQSASAPIRLQPSGNNLFQVLAASFGQVRVDALRTWTDYTPKKPVEVVERLRVSPVKGFLLELVALREQGSSSLSNELQMVSLLYPQNIGYCYFFRDFRVHDAARAQQNYDVLPMGTLSRSGRSYSIFDIRPRLTGRCSYRILVDDATGLALDRVEFDGSGRVTSTLFYEPAATKLGGAAESGLQAVKEFWKPWMIVRDFSTVSAAEATLSFKPRIPTVVETGFGLGSIRTTRTDSLSEPFLVLVYDNGVATRIVAQSKVGPTDKWPLDFGAKSAGDVPVFQYRLGPHAQFLARYAGIQYLMVGSFPDAGVIPPMLDELLR
ncbi:MAG: hypothetical protein KDC95_14140 [Planctomycetes bacterium]|nr:hypothetical protein [Planctomycetota bacterium]